MDEAAQLADKKKAILESTLKLVEENGFHGTPMSLVAKKAGVAAGTIYHYFESKEQLICELYTYVKQQILSVIQKDDQTRPYQERFFAIWLSLYRFYIQNPNVLRFFEQFVNSPYTRKAKYAKDPFHEKLFSFFKEGIEAGHLKAIDPEILGVLAHGNVITTAKIYGYGKIALGDKELTQIRLVLWDGMVLK